MYMVYSVRDTIRVPPQALGGELNKALQEKAQEEYEGIVDNDLGVVVAVTKAEKSGEGKIVPGDGGVYFDSKIDMLCFTPKLHEVSDAVVSEITEFGAFIKTGPIEGLVHVSQIMDDFIDYDAKAPSFVGKETGKRIKIDDEVIARTVTVSLKGSVSNSKIGYTMRQLGLGKREWLQEDEKKGKKGKDADKGKESKKDTDSKGKKETKKESKGEKK